ncbi:hypothetical protein LEMA_P066530.1 [Plenodomus lingam JN3]|uniref:Inhibitor I9 domain-containing protein n=1 Tax=Leptosphaeria maculans (strain JN3 / isolate v23.1.3 / race Av1-4-5-6-7-8) TaxID=985895 RepID=E4ZGV7_LEPMJ|nr:hypothetical protein LEMA_P066530.1 [Plenodomus lingam JN3]CBX90527.1 hypothetical protein LEMA_P066530.1 [Plenodomus lingam JN3]
MRHALFSLVIALLAAFAMAVAPLRSVILTWPHDTPDCILDDVKQAIIEAQGTITHEYTIIKGIAAMVSESALESVSALSSQYTYTLEEDSIMSTQEDQK